MVESKEEKWMREQVESGRSSGGYAGGEFGEMEIDMGYLQPGDLVPINPETGLPYDQNQPDEKTQRTKPKRFEKLLERFFKEVLAWVRKELLSRR